MAQISTTDIRGGVRLEIDGQPYTVISNDFVKPGKGQSFNRIRLKHLLTLRVVEITFKSGEKLEIADVVDTKMRMLYKEQDGVIFMDEGTYEQHKLSLEMIGDIINWLKDDLLYDIIFYKGNPVTVEPPTFMDLRIIETMPGARGNTASGRVMKPATLETGVEIKVPIFVDQDELITVDTRTGEYVSRVNESN